MNIRVIMAEVVDGDSSFVLCESSVFKSQKWRHSGSTSRWRTITLSLAACRGRGPAGGDIFISISGSGLHTDLVHAHDYISDAEGLFT